MFAIVSLLLVIAISLLVTRVATVVLTATGLTREVARFQARSAFTGSGFTTSESENVVSHPVRRRVVMLLMLLGNAGLVAGVSSLMLGFTHGGRGAGVEKLALLVVGLLLLVTVSRSQRIDRRLTQAIRRLLGRYTDIDTRDYVALLDLAGDYTVSELSICEGDWTEGRTLAELALRDEGIAVLGLTRRGVYHGTPGGETELAAGDVLVLYGRRGELAELDCRPAGDEGDRLHAAAVARHRGRRSRPAAPAVTAVSE